MWSLNLRSCLRLFLRKKVMDDIKQVRKEIQYNYKKYEELEEGDPQKLDVGDKLNLLFEDASKNYNNIMAMLPLAIEDIKTRLLLAPSSSKTVRRSFPDICRWEKKGSLRFWKLQRRM